MDAARAFGPRPRRIVGAVVVAALLALAVVVHQLGPLGPGTAAGPADPTSEPPQSTVSTVPGPPAPTPAPRPSGTPEPTGPAGPGTTEPGILVTATLVGEDSLTVREQVRLAEPTGTLTLRPIDLTRLSSDFEDHTASATDIELTAGGQSLIVPDGQVTTEVRLTLPAAVTEYTLTYSLRDTVVQTPPSTAGRGLGAVGPLSAGVPGDLPVVVYATGRSVLNLYCPTLTDVDRQICADGAVPRLHTEASLPWRDALVVIQLDLLTRRR